MIWPIFVLLGLEHVRIDPGNTRLTPLDFYDYPWTHSLLAAVVWGTLFAGVWYLRKRQLPTALLLAGLVASHWVLDWITHRPDLPLYPGGGPKVGLGLWNSVAGTVVVEGALFAGGVALYLQATRALDRVGQYALGGADRAPGDRLHPQRHLATAALRGGRGVGRTGGLVVAALGRVGGPAPGTGPPGGLGPGPRYFATRRVISVARSSIQRCTLASGQRHRASPSCVVVRQWAPSAGGGAGVAKLVDAGHRQCPGRKPVRVRISPSAPWLGTGLYQCPRLP